ncbi:glutathione S-transferase family protein [Paracraurococcus ruber]|nr:glutathione S-transferase family protein [Paracraurococcus ruber]
MAITLFHAPNTRSSTVLALLEELGAPFALRLLDLQAGEGRSPEFLAVNPLGKVPTLLDGDTPVTEQVAICLHLADRFPQAGLAPAPDDPLRGRYLRWLVFYAASFEPAVIDRATQRDPAPQRMSPYGTYDAVMDAVAGMLTPGPYVLGERYSAADVVWGSALAWTLRFGIVPALPIFQDYAGRITARPAFQRARARDAAAG